MRLKVLLSALAVAWMPSSAWGIPTFAPVGMPNNKPLPTEVSVTAGGRPVEFWATYGGYSPLALPGSTDLAAGSKPLLFMQSLSAAAEEIGPGGTPYVLLAKAEPGGRNIVEYLGWVARKYLLDRQRALIDDTTNITKKAMIVSSKEVLDALRKGIPAKDIPMETSIRPRPFEESEADAGPGRKVQWFSYYFVYAEDIDGCVLLGTNDSFRTDNAEILPHLVMLGWCRSKDVCIWNTREAFWWDHANTAVDSQPRRTTLGGIYDNPADAYSAVDSVDRDPKAVMWERRKANSPTTAPFPSKPRFPKLAWDGTSKYPAYDPDKRTALYKVGWIGSAVDENEPVFDLEELQRRLAALLLALDNIDVLFVIDDTLSMEDWFSRAADIVDEIKRDVENNARGNVRIAVSYYNDVEVAPGGKHRPKTSPLTEIRKPEAAALIRELRSHKVVTGVESGLRESLFDGISQAVAAAGFDNPDAQKLIVVVGDCADHAPVTNEAAAERELVRSNFLPSLPFPLELYAVQVRDNFDPTDERYVDLIDFEKQMRATVRILNDEYKKRAVPADARKNSPQLGDFFRSSNAALVRGGILSRFRNLDAERTKIVDQIKQIQEGNVHTEITPALMETLKRIDFPLEQLQANNSIQVFREGWAWESAAQPGGGRLRQLRPWVLLKKEELEDLAGLIGRLIEDRRGLGNVSLKDVISAQIKQLAGDYDPKQRERLSWAEAIKMKQGLPVSSRTRLLNVPLEQLIEEFSSDDLDYLSGRHYKLLDILEQKQSRMDVQSIVDPNTTQTYRVRKRVIVNKTAVDRTYYIRGSNSPWYWIDVDEELP